MAPAVANSARPCRRGILAKDTHGMTIRLAPPICITEEEVDLLVDTVREIVTASAS